MRAKRVGVILLLAVLFFHGSTAFVGSSFAAGSNAAQKSTSAAGGSFYAPFDTFDATRWLKSIHTLERTTFLPENVTVKESYLRIKLPAETLTGGEIESVDFFGYGIYTARMKLPNAPSSITGFFMYRSPDLYHEIDIEIFNDSSRRIDFTTYAQGKRTHTVTKTLPFDPTQGFHDYRIVYKPNYVGFYVDGKLFQAWRGGITSMPMKLLVNAWYPRWLEGKPPAADQFLEVDWIAGQK